MKKLVKLCAIFSLAGMLAGCGTTVGGAGGSKEDLNINVKDMANELKSGLTFEDTLQSLMQAWHSHITELMQTA